MAKLQSPIIRYPWALHCPIFGLASSNWPPTLRQAHASLTNSSTLHQNIHRQLRSLIHYTNHHYSVTNQESTKTYEHQVFGENRRVTASMTQNGVKDHKVTIRQRWGMDHRVEEVIAFGMIPGMCHGNEVPWDCHQKSSPSPVSPVSIVMMRHDCD